MRSKNRRILLPYSIVILFAYIGFSLPLPILPEMFLDPDKSIFPPEYDLKIKMLFLGLIMASFPFGQFFGSPFLGHLSDLYGRKRVILCSLAGTTVGYLITAASVSAHSVAGMFFGLAFCGFCEGNVTIAQSVIADLTREEGLQEEKAIHFGWINIFISLGFVAGPLMGGQLADSSVVSWFTFATPFWMAACMTVIGIVVIYKYSKETLKSEGSKEWQFFKSVWVGFKKKGLKIYLIANFFLAIGYFSFFRFLPVFLERTFNFSPAQLGYIMVYDALMIGIGVVLLIPPLARRYKPVKSLAIFSFLLAISFIVCILPTNPYALIVTIPPIGLFLAVTITNGSLVISNEASKEFQGQAMGTLTSVQVLAEFLTGIFGGVLAAKTMTLPLYVGSLMSVVCGVVLLTASRRIIRK